MRRRLLVLTDLEKANPRIPRIVKYLPREGWGVTLVVPRPSSPIEDLFFMSRRELERAGIDIVEIGKGERGMEPKTAFPGGLKEMAERVLSRPGMGRIDDLVRRLYWRAYVTINYPEPDVQWTEQAYPILRDIVSKGEHSIILTSSSPVTANIMASRLKKELGIPWVAEFRDLWSLNHNSPFGPFMRMVDRRLERKTMANADAIVTVTEDLAQKQKEMHGNERTVNIPIAYDRSESPEGVAVTSDFTLTYTGAYYEGKQDPLFVLKGVKELIDEGTIDRSRTKVRFYGTNDHAIKRYVEEIGLGDVVLFHPRVRREQSLRRQMESQVLLYFNWEDEREKGTCSLKLIEYLFAGRPILLTGGVPDNLLANIVVGTGSGVHVSDKDGLKRSLSKMYRDYIAQGSVPCTTREDAIEPYEVGHSVRSYVKLFSEVVEAHERSKYAE